MDKGQHLRLLIVTGSGTPTKKVIALAVGLTFHLSAATQDSTTKDSTDTNGTWNEYEITQRSGDIQIESLIGTGSDTAAESLSDIMELMNDSPIDWELAIVGGANNRTVTTTICTGKGKLSSINPQGQNRQNATYNFILNIYGPVTVVS